MPQKRATLCANCNNGKPQIFSEKCDVCDTKMTDWYDTDIIKQLKDVGYQHVQSLKKMFPLKD